MWTFVIGKDALCPCYRHWIAADHHDLRSWTITCSNNNYPKYWLLHRTTEPSLDASGILTQAPFGDCSRDYLYLQWSLPPSLEYDAVLLHPLCITAGAADHTKPLLAMVMGTMAISNGFFPAPKQTHCPTPFVLLQGIKFQVVTILPLSSLPTAPACPWILLMDY